MKLVILVLASALGAPSEAQACTCALGKIEQVVAREGAVFEGELVSSELGPDGERNSKFLVQAAYKGVRLGETIVVRSRDPNGKSCDLVAVTPGRWLLLVSPAPDGALWIGRCDGYTQRVTAQPSATVARVRKLFHAKR